METWTRGGRGSKILEILRTSHVRGPLSYHVILVFVDVHFTMR